MRLMFGLKMPWTKLNFSDHFAGYNGWLFKAFSVFKSWTRQSYEGFTAKIGIKENKHTARDHIVIL